MKRNGGHSLLTALLTVLFLWSQQSSATTCADLNGAYVYSQEPTSIYLGFFGNAFASESINNTFSTYGSQFSALSVRNTFGSYGSQFSIYSANNEFTVTPPAIYKWGVIIGYLTTNPFVIGGISLPQIDFSCQFFATSPSTFPTVPSGLIASDGVYADSVRLTWLPSLGATGYRVYYSDSLVGQPTFLGASITPFTNIFQLQPQVTYYFWISAVNNFGESALSLPDSGFAAEDTDADGIPDGIDNCPDNENADQLDSDSDGAGDVCDPDDDNDGVPDTQDDLPFNSSESVDTDGDGVGNNADTDDDGDGMPDSYETNNGFDPVDPNDGYTDADGDGFSNLREFRAGTDPNDSDSKPAPDLSGVYLLLLAGNVQPVADAGADQNVIAGAVVSLDGSGSSDADGDSLSYSWTFVSVPSGSFSIFDNAAVANPSFIADLAGTYVIGLVVNDGFGVSLRDTVQIEVMQPTVTLLKKRSSLLNPTFDEVQLPYFSNSSTAVTVTGIPAPTTYTLDTFKLVAAGRTFTIVNVSATDVTGRVLPYFDALPNGYLLADGEEVTFDLVSPLTSGEQAQLQFNFEILESGESFSAAYTFTSN